MYCGHIAIGLAAKGFRPRLPLWLLLLAAFGPDWLETLLIAVAVPNTPLLSHSIPAVAIGATAAGIAVAAYAKTCQPPVTRRLTDTLFVAGLYTSHLLVDYLTGYKPLGFGNFHLGARLYDHPLIDFTIESTLILIGWQLYRRSLPTPSSRRPLTYALPITLIALQAAYHRFFAHG